MAQHGMTEKEVRDPSVEIFGSVEQAVQVQANMEAQNLAALQEMLPGGYESCPIFIGRKPREGEEVMYAPLNADVAIRVWGEGWELYNAYSFDFVDGQGKHVCAPDDVKIYATLHSRRRGAIHRAVHAKGLSW